MAKTTNRLTTRTIQSISKPGYHADGDGLYLVVDKSGAKRWAYIFQWDKKRTEMGLGNLASLGLADAREKAADARKVRGSGRNPIAVRKDEQAAQASANVTFGEYAETYVAAVTKDFRNKKHKQQWRMTLSVERDADGNLVDSGYCLALRKKRFPEITTEDILGVLQPIWETVPETASRLQNRIERILDAAKVKGYRSGDNPARWRGHLNAILKKRSSKKVEHHAAMPYRDVPAFIAKLREASGMGALALEFTILVAKRTAETRYATVTEFDLEEGTWLIPKERMKAERDHTVVLPARAKEIVEELIESRTSDLVFQGQKKGRPISEGTMTKAMVTAGAKDVTVHGFRSSFKDWATEETNFDRMLSEAALAHLVGDETERAYKRGEMIKKRRKLMDAWERYCLAPPKSNNVLPFAGNRSPAA